MPNDYEGLQNRLVIEENGIEKTSNEMEIQQVIGSSPTIASKTLKVTPKKAKILKNRYG